MLANELIIEADSLLGEATRLKRDGYRFVTMTAQRLNEAQIEVLYHFDRELHFRHLRLTVTGDVPVPSITPVYFGAFLTENEIQDLFGILFEGLVIDYRRTLFLEKSSEPAPFCRFNVKRKAQSDPSAGEER